MNRVDLLKSQVKTLPHYQKSIAVKGISAILQKKKGLIIVGDMHIKKSTKF